MQHREYCKLNPDSDTAFLFIHGIAGTPNHFKDFVPLVSGRYSVCNMLLDGHGKGVREFSESSMEKWKAQVDEKLAELRQCHENIVIAAHSMGTLFALQQAVRCSDKIKAMFLLAVPLKLLIKPAMFVNSFKVYSGNIKDSDRKALAAKNACGIENDKRFWRYLAWLPRYLELFSEIEKTKRLISSIAVPCYVYQSKNDEMVSPAAVKILEANSFISTSVLENSSHYYYDDADYRFILSEFSSLAYES